MPDSKKSSDLQQDLTSNPDSISRLESRVPLAYSISPITTCRSSLADDVKLRDDFGIPTLSLWRRKLDEHGVEASVGLIRQSGQSVSTISFAGGFTGRMGMPYAEAMNDAYDALFTAAALKARTLIIAPGGRGSYTAKHERKLVALAIRELATAAKELGIQLAVHPMSERFAGRWTSLHTLQDTVALLGEVSRANVGLVLDTFHFGSVLRDLATLNSLLPHLAVVQLSDGDAGAHSEYARSLPGDGKLPLADFLAWLLDAGFDGDLDVQVWSETVWQQPAGEIVRRVRERMELLMAEAVIAQNHPLAVRV